MTARATMMTPYWATRLAKMLQDPHRIVGTNMIEETAKALAADEPLRALVEAAKELRAEHEEAYDMMHTIRCRCDVCAALRAFAGEGAGDG